MEKKEKTFTKINLDGEAIQSGSSIRAAIELWAPKAETGGQAGRQTDKTLTLTPLESQ